MDGPDHTGLVSLPETRMCPIKSLQFHLIRWNLKTSVDLTLSSKQGSVTTQGANQEMSDSPPVKTLQDKGQPHAHRNSEQQVQQSECGLNSLLTDYIEAKRKKGREARDRPPWWTKYR